MARSRNIKPAFFSNEVLGETSPLARLLFIALWTLADREGRLENRPKKIKIEALPYDDCDVSKLLQELAGRGFIQIYEVQNVSYIQVVNFRKHQNPHMKEQASTIPAPDLHGASTEQAGLIPSSLLPHTETNRSENENYIDTDAAPAGIETDIGDSLQDDEPVAAKPEKPAAEPEQKADIPDWLDKATWLAFRQHRKKIKKTLTPHGERLMFADLLDWKNKGHDPVAIINNSIKNGWTGLFAPKEPPKPSYRDYEPPKRADGYSACSARHERRN